MVKIRVGDLRIDSEIKKAVMDVLDSEMLTESTQTALFEREFANYIGTKYAVATSSGTSSLIVSLLALKHKYKLSNGYVICPAITYIADFNAIVLAGFKPIFCDLIKDGFVMDVDEVEKLIKSYKNIACIIPIHLKGYPVDMDKIMKLANEYNIPVIEDACQSLGTLYKGKKTGSIGLAGCFSGYIAHQLAYGEGGMIVTNDLQFAQLCRAIKSNGRMCVCEVCTRQEGKCPYKDSPFEPRFYSNAIGGNFRTTDLLSAIARSRLKKIDWILEKRRYNVRYLNKKLSKFKELKLPEYSEDVSYIEYPIITSTNELCVKLRRELEFRWKVEARPIEPIAISHPSFEYLATEYGGKLKNASYLHGHCFFIGIHEFLEQKDLDYIADCFDKILKRRYLW